MSDEAGNGCLLLCVLFLLLPVFSAVRLFPKPENISEMFDMAILVLVIF